MNSINTQDIPGKSWARYFIGFFIFSNVIDMAGNIGIKYASSILLLFYIAFHLRSVRLSKYEVISLLIFAFLFPLISLLIGIIGGASINSIFTPLPIVLTLPLIYLALKIMPAKQIINYLFSTLYFLAAIVIFANILAFFSPSTFTSISPLLELFFSNIDLYQGTRTDALVGKVYPRATLFFVAAGIYYFFIGNLFRFFVLLFALILAVSKSGVLILIMLMLFKIQKGFLFSSKFIIFISIFVALGFLTNLIYPNYYDVLISLFIGQSETANLRIRHAVSFLDYFDQNWTSLFFGQGIGTSFFTLGNNSFEMNIELDHLETIRRYGLIWATAFYATVLLICFRLIFMNTDKSNSAIGIALFAGFIAAGTNPVLISPPFMILLVGAYGSLNITNMRYSQSNLNLKY